MKHKIIRDLDLAKTFDSGQVFSWEFIDGAYIAPIGGTLYELRQVGLNEVQAGLISGEFEEEKFKSYFDLGRDYKLIYDQIADKHPELKDAVKRARGIRLLKQDSIEMLFTFIFSQNNHIPRIKRSMVDLKQLYGFKIGTYRTHDFYALPCDEALLKLTEDDFRKLGAGYRAPYLVSAAKEIQDLRENLSEAALDSAAIINRLLKIHGIGPKVAACIALFGYGSWDVFPVDTWVRKALKYYYGSEGDNPGFIKQKIEDFAPYSSLVQQLMFYHTREGNKDERRTKNK